MEDFIDERARYGLQIMLSVGFDDALVSTEAVTADELSIAHNEASLLRSTEQHSIALTGIVGGRKASTELTDLSDENIRAAASRLLQDAQSAPVDTANAVSEAQSGRVERGPLTSDADMLALKAQELLDFRANEAQQFQMEEASASHMRVLSKILTSRGSDINENRGWYSLGVMGTARNGEASSSLNYTGGAANALDEAHAADYFGIRTMMHETIAQTHPKGLDEKFSGEVILTPHAACDFLYWLLGQLSDVQLISGSSLYRDSVGAEIAASILSIRSHFDAPGVSATSADAFTVHPVHLLDKGVLNCLLPSQYGSLKTGIAHVPVSNGWEIDAGETALEDMVSGVEHGALVGRLSMGAPAANGDFSGVIKNSFLLRHGQQANALAEVMITGNMAKMLKAITAISRERLDTGSLVMPWIRIPGVVFS